MNQSEITSRHRSYKTTLHNLLNLIIKCIMALDNRQLCEWFLSHGADPNAQCDFDETPLSAAVMRALRDIIELLFQHGGSIEKGQLPHCAVHRHKPARLDIIRMLLDKGCNTNAIGYENHSESYKHYNWLFGLGTPLYEAAEYNHLAVVELLLANGANPLICNSGANFP
jgi:ankyrin repeat protein